MSTGSTRWVHHSHLLTILKEKGPAIDHGSITRYADGISYYGSCTGKTLLLPVGDRLLFHPTHRRQSLIHFHQVDTRRQVRRVDHCQRILDLLLLHHAARGIEQCDDVRAGRK